MTRSEHSPKSTPWFGRLLNDYCHREEGVSAAIVSLSMVAIIGMGALALDVGRTYGVQRWLQNSADSAALAGAEYIDDGSAGSTTISGLDTDSANAVAKFGASTIGGVTGFNAKTNISVTTSAQLECLNLGVSCIGATGSGATAVNNANAIQVKQTATIPMFFAEILGVQSMTVSAVAVAEAGGFSAKPYNIMFILDATQSMTDADTDKDDVSGGCGSTVTQETCAQAGIRLFLQKMNPATDSIGLLTFPELLTPALALTDAVCPTATSSPIASKYTALSEDEGSGLSNEPTGFVSDAAWPTYEVVAPETTYSTVATSSKASAPNATDPLVIAVGGGACDGMTAFGGLGTFYADAIDQAQTILASLKSSGTASQKAAQNVIIMVSDGNATSTKIYTTAANGQTNASVAQCEQGFHAATAATAAGTWVFTLAFGSPTTAPSGSNASCTTDSASESYSNPTVKSPVSPANSACYAMQNMASQPGFFFADQSLESGQTNACISPANPSLSGVIALINNVANVLQKPRLLPPSGIATSTTGTS
jgi:hypothetical protein